MRRARHLQRVAIDAEGNNVPFDPVVTLDGDAHRRHTGTIGRLRRQDARRAAESTLRGGAHAAAARRRRRRARDSGRRARRRRRLVTASGARGGGRGGDGGGESRQARCGMHDGEARASPRTRRMRDGPRSAAANARGVEGEGEADEVRADDLRIALDGHALRLAHGEALLPV